jgi:hypothetical protein
MKEKLATGGRSRDAHALKEEAYGVKMESKIRKNKNK